VVAAQSGVDRVLGAELATWGANARRGVRAVRARNARRGVRAVRARNARRGVRAVRARNARRGVRAVRARTVIYILISKFKTKTYN